MPGSQDGIALLLPYIDQSPLLSPWNAIQAFSKELRCSFTKIGWQSVYNALLRRK
jgi:hypothetical protein